MHKKRFNFTDVLSFAWDTTISNIGFFIVLGIIYALIFLAFFILQQITIASQLDRTVVFVINTSLNVINNVISIILGIGLIKISLAFCDGYKPSVGKLFDFWGSFWKYIGTAILYALIVMAGTLLLIVPGIIWGIKFWYAFYFVVDRDMGPIQALKASAKATRGVKWQLVGFMLLAQLIYLAGFLAFFVGVFVTYPILLISLALVYRQISNQTPELNPQPVPVTE